MLNIMTNNAFFNQKCKKQQENKKSNINILARAGT